MKLVCLVMFVIMSQWSLADGTSDEEEFDAELDDARQMIESSRYEQAIQMLGILVKQESGSADAWNLLGYSHRKLGNLEDAAHSYRQALLYNPEHKGALEYQGELFLALNDLAGARENLHKLREVCPAGCEELADLEEALADQ